MTTLKFADTHNMVVFLSKPAKSKGFEQIVDFLNAHPIKHALTLQALVDRKKKIITESTVRRDLQLEDVEGVDCLPNAAIFEQLALMGYEQTQTPRELTRVDTKIPQSSGPMENVADEVVHKERGDRLVRAATTASSLKKEQDSGSGPRRQETMGDTIAQTRSKNVSKLSNDPLLARGITLVSTHFDADTDMFGVHDLVGDEVVVESEVAVKASEMRNVVKEVVVVIDTASTIPVSTATITDVEITLAQALAELKSAKPKADKVVIQEPEHGTTITTPTTIIPVPKPLQDKGKGIMIEEPMVEQVKPIKRLEQMRLDEELAFKLQTEEEEEEEEERLA
ncbi:hypothetical protein Tco_0053824 [Tanacetum coccineum]